MPLSPQNTAAPPAAFRERVGLFIESGRLQKVIVALILINAVTLGLETSPAIMAVHGTWLQFADTVILSVFVAEIATKLYAFGWRFFRSAWNVFDFVVVGIALLPAAGAWSVLRTLRVLRVMRLLSMVPSMRLVVESLLRAVPGIASIFMLLAVVYYVSAVIATNLFMASHPQWFGDVGRSMFTLFQIMTLESWSSGIARPVMEVHPYAWIFFVSFILIATFMVLNLFIAIIVNAMQSQSQGEMQATMLAVTEVAHTEADHVERELAALRAEISALRAALTGARRSP